jgi:hypothetical protein
MNNMYKKLVFLFVLFCLNITWLHAQPNVENENIIGYDFGVPVKKDRYKIAILTPLYLDSFDLEKNLINLPSYATPGIDFYQGAMIAADTLNKADTKITIYVFDSKSKYLNINTLLATDKLSSMDCIIGNIGGLELKTIAEFANKNKINFISAVSPSDADQKNNPFFTLLNPKLNTHVERMHKKIQLSYASANIIYAHRTASNEINAYQYYINDPYTQSTVNPTEYIVPEEGIDESKLAPLLDKTKTNIIVLGILDAKTAYNNLKIITKLANDGYVIKVYGMPTWENIKALKVEKEFPNLEIFYTSSLIVDKVTTPSIYVQNKYRQQMGSTASEIVYKGFEATYLVANLLQQFGTPFNQKFNENGFTFITPYRLMPVIDDFKLKYFENKFLYIVKYKNGLMTYE